MQNYLCAISSCFITLFYVVCFGCPFVIGTHAPSNQAYIYAKSGVKVIPKTVPS
jgi:hypothetical protein